MATDWGKHVRKYAPDADDGVIGGIVRYCGIALQNRDSALVSFSDPKELARVRGNFLKKKLGLTAPDDVLDAAIAAVGARLKGDRTKHRVTVYYLLAEAHGKLDLFVKTPAKAAEKPAAKTAKAAKVATPAEPAPAAAKPAKKAANAKAEAKPAAAKAAKAEAKPKAAATKKPAAKKSTKAAAGTATGVATIAANLGEKAGTAASAAKEVASEAVDAAKEAADKAGAAIASAAESASEAASAAAHSAADLAGKAADAVGEVAESAVEAVGAGAQAAVAAASGAADKLSAAALQLDDEHPGLGWLWLLLLGVLAAFAIWWLFLGS